jgi:hypothetical protein
MRIVPFLIALFALIFSVWFFYDGFITFPMENAKIQSQTLEIQSARQAGETAAADRLEADLRGISRHNDASILVQKVLGVIFAIVGGVLLLVSFWPRRAAGES